MEELSPSKQKLAIDFLLNSASNGFRMCARYEFQKPNDRRALDVMNAAAKAVMVDIPEITIGYGVSDEYRYDGTCI